MPEIYLLQKRGKLLFYLAAFICIISLFLIPFGILFIVMAIRAKIVVRSDHLSYTMLWTKKIFYKDITKITLAKPVNPRYYIQQQKIPGIYVNLATVVPLIIHHNNKKTRISSNFFNDSIKFLEILQEKTKKRLEIG